MTTQDIYSHTYLDGNSLIELMWIYSSKHSKEKYSPTSAFWINGVDYLS
jgi:hypothetical protein